MNPRCHLIQPDHPRQDLSPRINLWILKKGLPIVYSSDKFTYTTGYTRGDVLFKPISLEFMAGPKTDNAISMIESGMEKQETFQASHKTIKRPLVCFQSINNFRRWNFDFHKKMPRRCNFVEKILSLTLSRRNWSLITRLRG